MPKSPAINRSGPTAPTINRNGPTIVKNRTTPESVRYYADGNLGEAGGGTYGGYYPFNPLPPVATGYDAGSYDDGTYDS